MIDWLIRVKLCVSLPSHHCITRLHIHSHTIRSKNFLLLHYCWWYGLQIGQWWYCLSFCLILSIWSLHNFWFTHYTTNLTSVLVTLDSVVMNRTTRYVWRALWHLQTFKCSNVNEHQPTMTMCKSKQFLHGSFASLHITVMMNNCNTNNNIKHWTSKWAMNAICTNNIRTRQWLFSSLPYRRVRGVFFVSIICLITFSWADVIWISNGTLS